MSLRRGMMMSLGEDSDVKAFIARVEADGGTIINTTYLKDCVSYIKSISKWNNIDSWVSANFAVRKDGSNKVNKVYCLKGKDLEQTTSAIQPLFMANQSGDKAAIYFTPGQNLVGTVNIGIDNIDSRHKLILFKQTVSANTVVYGWGNTSVFGGLDDTFIIDSHVIAVGNGAENSSGSAVSPPYSVNTWAVHEREFSYGGTPSHISSINNGTRYTFLNSSNLRSTPLRWATAVFGGYESFTGYITDTPILNVTLSDSERTNFVDFLRTQYSI